MGFSTVDPQLQTLPTQTAQTQVLARERSRLEDISACTHAEIFLRGERGGRGEDDGGSRGGGGGGECTLA